MSENDTVLLERKCKEDEGKKVCEKEEPEISPWP